MSDMEYLDEPVNVIATIGEDNQFIPQSFIWRGRKYLIITHGRQWVEENHRHLLVEASDGTRFELELNLDASTWRIKRVWWGQLIA